MSDHYRSRKRARYGVGGSAWPETTPTSHHSVLYATSSPGNDYVQSSNQAALITSAAPPAWAISDATHPSSAATASYTSLVNSTSGRDDATTPVTTPARQRLPSTASVPAIHSRPSCRGDFHVAIICALKVEYDAVSLLFDEFWDDDVDPFGRAPGDTNHYTTGRIARYDVVLALLPNMGKAMAAGTASSLRSSYPNLKLALLVGVCGAVPMVGSCEVLLGDVVVSKTVSQYDLGRQYPNKFVTRDTTEESLGRPNKDLRSLIASLETDHWKDRIQQKAARHLEDLQSKAAKKRRQCNYRYPGPDSDKLFAATYRHKHRGQQLCKPCDGELDSSCDEAANTPCLDLKCDESQLVHRERLDVKRTFEPHEAEQPEIFIGGVASGDTLMTSGEHRDQLAAEFGFIAFEMEGAGAWDEIPCIIIKGVCNYADSHKNKVWQPFAAATAAAVAKAILERYTRTDNPQSAERIAVSLPERPIPNDGPSLTKECRQSLRLSLECDQIDARHTTIKRAHLRTCKWLRKKDKYIDWLNPSKIPEHHGFLWIKGNPGTGKSTLMKFAFDQAQKTMKDKVVLSFFFNARGDELEQSTTGMYRSLLSQLLRRITELDVIFDSTSLSAWTQGRDIHWSVELLKDLFEKAIQNLSRSWVVCFIDALDECNEDHIRDMISFFEHVGSLAMETNVRFQVCFSSRYYPHITIARGLELELEGQEGHDQDIANYIDTELKIGHDKFAQELKAEVQAKSSGVFIWVVLVVDILNKDYDRGRPQNLRKRLGEIPARLHDLFRDILTRDSRNREGLILCIQWILFAKYPLRPEELYFAILAGTDDECLEPWDQELVTPAVIQRFIVDSSKGLVETTKSKTPKVQFIHESVRDFFLKDNGLQEILPNLKDQFQRRTHTQLKECCQKYICANIAESLHLPEPLPKASSKEAADFRNLAQISFPFLTYAIRYVLYHADKAESGRGSENSFLQSFPLQKWIYFHNLFERRQIRHYTPQANLLHQAAEDSYLAVATLLIETGTDKDGKDNANRTPLYWAAWKGDLDVVRLLIDLGADKNAQDNTGRTPLSRAVRSDRLDIVRFLIQANANKEAKDIRGWSPLIWAAFSGQSDAMRLLLDLGADIETRDNAGQTPLSLAAHYGRIDTIRLLIDLRADIETRDNGGRTPLSWAAIDSQLDTMRLLIDLSADIETRDNTGQTPLSSAAYYGDVDTIRLLIDLGADIETRDNTGRTPLSSAAYYGYVDTIRLLIDLSADIETRDNTGQTPLSRAAYYGYVDTIRLLIDLGADMETRDNTGQTPLSSAAYYGYVDAIRLLIDLRADIETRDNGGWTPLSWAAFNSQSDTIRLLIDLSADIETKDDDGRTPLSWATYLGHIDMMRLLIELGANMEARDNNGQTPLSRAASCGESDAIRLLIELGADIETRDNNGQRLPFLDTLADL